MSSHRFFRHDPTSKSLSPYISKRMLTVVQVPDFVENASGGFHPELKPD
ncbi:MAG: hypothetical protein WA947_09545 [Phormidesmis sp.]